MGGANGRELAPTTWIVFKLLVLAALIMAAGYWFSRHFAFMDAYGGLLTTLLGTMTTVVGYWATTSGRSAKRVVQLQTKRYTAKLFDWLLAPMALMVMTLLVVGLGSTISSVSVRAETVAGPLSVDLHDDQDRVKELDHDRLSVSFMVMTTPLGRFVPLKVEGRLRTLVDVKPWTGTVVRVERLPATPTLYLRLPHSVCGAAEGGWFEVTRHASASGPRTESTHKVATKGVQGAVSIGPPRTPGENLREIWRLGLRGEAVSPAGQAAVELAWRNAAIDGTITQILPGQELTVLFKIDDGGQGTARASLRVLVTADRFQDHLLKEFE